MANGAAYRGMPCAGALTTQARRNDVHDNEEHVMKTATVVLEPGVNIDLSITAWFRVSAGAAYRFVGGVASDASSGSDLSGPSGMLTLHFGSF